MRKSSLLILWCACSNLLVGQTEKYFQQQVDFEIHVSLDDKNHRLIGKEKMVYKNNSPNSLEYIFIHLWPNAYKDDDTDLAKQLFEDNNLALYYAGDQARGYIEDLDFKVNGKKASWNYDIDHKDICRIYFDEPLLPGESVTITTPFVVKIPFGTISRLGRIGQQYQITQWFPKPAVYDNDGWHQMPYLSIGEFYSEFGTFDVHITVPENYVVGATGDMVNAKSELKWLDEKVSNSLLLDSTRRALIRMADTLDTDTVQSSYANQWVFPESSPNLKTLHFHQENVHDFAWFADKRYRVLKGEVTLPHSKRKVTTWALFNEYAASEWIHAIQYINDAVYYYSLWNGDYPYNHCTAVDGSISAGSGMEYPNITVVASADSLDLEEVIAHEVGHNWFYGILGSNERDHAWMDEGINSYYEARYLEVKHPGMNYLNNDEKMDKVMKFFGLDVVTPTYANRISYEYLAQTNNDQPVDTRSQEMTPTNYFAMVYGKGAVAFKNLEGYLGRETFDSCMQAYFEKWKFKHPQPKDLQNVIEDVSGKKLDWFFNKQLKTTGQVDLKIRSLKKDTADLKNKFITIKDKGDFSVPFSITALKKDSILFTVWNERMTKKKQTFNFPAGDYDRVRVDHSKFTFDMNRQNNTLKTKGLCKKIEPLKLQLLFSPEDGNKTELYYSPLLAWNIHDGFMIGASAFNSTVVMKKFEYVLAPMYATKSKTITGFASAGYSFNPAKFIREIRVQANARRFTFNNNPINQAYNKVAPEVEFLFKRRFPRKKVDMSIKLRTVYINHSYDIATLPSESFFLEPKDYYLNQLSYKIVNSTAVNPFSVNVMVEQGEKFVKAGATARMAFKYRAHGKAFRVQFFAGRFIYNDNAHSQYNFGVSGGNDYAFDHLFLGRTTQLPDVTSQQFMMTEGTMKHLSGFAPPGGSGVQNPNSWLNTISMSSTLPKVPLSLYADAGIAGYEIIDSSGDLVDETSEPFWDAGISLDVVPGSIQVFFPIAFSHNLNQLRYVEKIRFSLDMTIGNIHKLKRSFLF